MKDRGPGLLGTGIAFIVLAWVTFCLRIYVRGFLLRSWGTDDWLIACAIVCLTLNHDKHQNLPTEQGFFTIYIICQTAGIVYGTGKHLQDLDPDRARTALIFWWLCELFYIPAAVFLKLSIGVFLHRIAINRYHVWLVRLMMFCSGLFGSVYFLLAIFQCKPISAWWWYVLATDLVEKFALITI
jgi:hypothetical protein